MPAHQPPPIGAKSGAPTGSPKTQPHVELRLHTLPKAVSASRPAPSASRARKRVGSSSLLHSGTRDDGAETLHARMASRLSLAPPHPSKRMCLPIPPALPSNISASMLRTRQIDARPHRQIQTVTLKSNPNPSPYPSPNANLLTNPEPYPKPNPHHHSKPGSQTQSAVAIDGSKRGLRGGTHTSPTTIFLSLCTRIRVYVHTQVHMHTVGSVCI